jgi:hypothetical protein
MIMTNLKCNISNCNSVYTTNQLLSPNATYRCSLHDKVVENTFFQKTQFDNRLLKEDKDGIKTLRKFLDEEDHMRGFQIIEAGRNRKPSNIENKANIKELLLRAFPKMQMDPEQRAKAGRWAEILYMYFSKHTYKDIAEHLGLTPKAVERGIHRIKNVSKGLSPHGGPRGLRPRGRPRNK